MGRIELEAIGARPETAVGTTNESGNEKLGEEATTGTTKAKKRGIKG